MRMLPCSSLWYSVVFICLFCHLESRRRAAPPSRDEGNVPSQASTEAGICLDLFITSTGQVGQVGGYFVLKNISSSWSGGEFAILLEDACWDFHQIQRFLVLRGSNALFSHLLMFFQCPNPNMSWRSSKDESMTSISVQWCAPWGKVQTASCRPAQIAECSHVSDPMKI